MTNRLTAAVRWLAQQARIYLAPRAAAREVCRLLGDERTGPQKKRTRQAGVLKAVLRVLADGPCPLAKVVAEVSTVMVGNGSTSIKEHRVYTRAQVVAALRYARKRGYVARGEDWRWRAICPEEAPGGACVDGPTQGCCAIVPEAGEPQVQPEAASGCCEEEG